MATEKELPEPNERKEPRGSDRRVLRVDRRVNDPDAKPVDELGLPLPDRRKVREDSRREEKERREIPIRAERPVHSCIYVENFQFHECTINSCKNHTEVTITKCLAIDRVQPSGNKIISDAELHLYKFSDRKVSTRLISIKRKKAIMRVKGILILHAFIDYIRDGYREKAKKEYTCKIIDKLESSYPLKVRKLQFENWMWPYLTSKKVWRKFATHKGGECEEFKVFMLLNLTRIKYDNLLKQLKDTKNEQAS